MTNNAINNHSSDLTLDSPLGISSGGTNSSSFTTTDGIVVSNGTSLVNYAGPKINSSSYVTNSTQPIFSVYNSTDQTNVTGRRETVTVDYDTVEFDIGSGFNTTTHTYIAPITGLYLFTYGIQLNLPGTYTGLNLSLNTNSLTNIIASITNITQANPAVVTVSDISSVANGQTIDIYGVLGMVEINSNEITNISFTVANVNVGAKTFELSGLDSSGYTAYSSEGTVELYAPANGGAGNIIFSGVAPDASDNYSINDRIIAQMTAGDFALVDIFVTGTTATDASIIASTATEYKSYFQGYLIV